MNFSELQNLARLLYQPVLLVEETLSHGRRKILEKILRIIFVVSLVASGVVWGSQYFLKVLSFAHFAPQLYAVSALFFVLWVLVFICEAMYYSYAHLKSPSSGSFMYFDLARIVHALSPEDITKTFFKTSIGKGVLARSGISQKEFEAFLAGRTVMLKGEQLTNISKEENIFTVYALAEAIFDQDKSLSEFFFAHGIQKKEFLAIVDWLVETEEMYNREEYWWSWESLGRIPGIGQNWSYGNIYNLEKYERVLSQVSMPRYEVHSSYGVDELKEVEAILARTRGANALLVGNDEAGKFQIVSHLSALIEGGEVTSRLRHKRVVVFDTDLFIAEQSTKEKFESEFIIILREAISAGNIVLVFPDFPSFILSSTSLGSDITGLLESYISTPDLQMIALSDMERFHSVIEKNSFVKQHFEPILIKDIDNSNTVKVLQNEILRIEQGKIFFTYQALECIATSAERYFSDGVMPDKAIDLLLEIVPKLLATKKYLVEKADVEVLVETKTGIPMGTVKTEEKEKLLHLEEILHKRVIGQDVAITAIANAVRRARSGIESPNRPLSSFLFLGPTGVGKTETTKALSEVFFGADGHVMRLDMSEYSSFDATSKLIGSFESNHTGVLASMLREHQYGVLLLDEFEKTTKEVMNLFLQILDEGFFSDMSGKKVNARNLIIIATSNAGSDLIWEAVKRGENVAEQKEKIVDSIIAQGIFKPELLNRFDGVIVFHPLGEEHLRKIAELSLAKLHQRLAEKGINLVIDENLINHVMSYGTDPKFGARPINRAIQEEIEQIVAKKIIAGSASAGSQIVLTPEELGK